MIHLEELRLRAGCTHRVRFFRIRQYYEALFLFRDLGSKSR